MQELKSNISEEYQNIKKHSILESNWNFQINNPSLDSSRERISSSSEKWSKLSLKTRFKEPKKVLSRRISKKIKKINKFRENDETRTWRPKKKMAYFDFKDKMDAIIVKLLTRTNE